MRKKLTLLLVSVFMVGLGGMLLFFELSEYTYETEFTVPNVAYKTISNTYAVDDVDQIRADSNATIVIDENQVGIKVDLTYIADVSNIKGYSYMYTYDCVVIGESTQCDTAQSKEALVVGYQEIRGPFRIKTAVDIMVNGLKNKILLNMRNLYRPQTTITLNKANNKLLLRLY
jgi:hypothetical protein